jgi:hypothetical protein
MLRDQCKSAICFLVLKDSLIGSCGSSYYKDEPRQPIYYEQSQPSPREHYIRHEGLDPHVRERQLPPSGEAPIYVRTIEPRRQVIVLE